MEKLLTTLKELDKFTEVELDQLRPKAAPFVAVTKGIATPNRFDSMGEREAVPASTESTAGWNFHPLFKPTPEYEPIVTTSGPSPGAAFSTWWGKPSDTIEEAQRRVDASNQISG